MGGASIRQAFPFLEAVVDADNAGDSGASSSSGCLNSRSACSSSSNFLCSSDK